VCVRYVQFYNFGGVSRAAPPVYEPAQIAAVPTPGSNLYMDEPTKGQGFVLLDQAHRNQFSLDDLTYLNGRLAARGYQLLPYTGGDLAAQLRPVSAFITIAPLQNFSETERQALRRFVERGGHLLLVGDPTRFEVVLDDSDPFFFDFQIDTNKIPLNTLAGEFDLVFNGDYLYNTLENEGNFRNIILRPAGFAASPLLEGVEQLVFYSAHSLQVGPTAVSLLTADDNTWSSTTGRAGGLVLAATAANGRVLALGDIHLLTEPYYTVYDNSRFIAQIADYLTQPAERAATLADFPFFYRQPVNLVYTGRPELGAGAFDQIVALQNAFDRVDLSLKLAAAPQPDHDVLYLGLYNQAGEVAEILASLGITLTIEPPIFTAAELAGATPEETDGEEEAEEEEETAVRLIQSSLGDVQMSGTALLAWVEENGRRSVIILAASQDGLANSVERLLALTPRSATDLLAGCLVQDPIALCPSNITDEAVEAELISGATPATPITNGTPTTTPAPDSPPISDLGAELQGEIALGETVEGTLELETSHAWTYSDGPTILEISVSGDDELDLVLELYDPQNVLIRQQDSGFTGEPETMRGVEIVDNGRYTIIVRDYYGEAGSYSLTVSEGVATVPGEGILLFIDDDDTPLNGGITSQDALLTWLEPDYAVTVWIASQDGPLTPEGVQSYDLIIWDSGDYQNESGLFDSDTTVLMDYYENGGWLFITGSVPALFGSQPLAPLRDLVVAGDDPVLMAGFDLGDILLLDQTYDAMVADVSGNQLDEDTLPMFLRGPQSDTSEVVASFAVLDEILNQRVVFLLFPFAGLPEAVQPLLLDNIFAWLGVPLPQS
jgi:hypothetical protein